MFVLKFKPDAYFLFSFKEPLGDNPLEANYDLRIVPRPHFHSMLTSEGLTARDFPVNPTNLLSQDPKIASSYYLKRDFNIEGIKYKKGDTILPIIYLLDK